MRARLLLTFAFIADRIVSESLRREASMSYKAISASCTALVRIQSPSTLRTKTVLPAPINVIFSIYHPFFVT